MSRFNKHDEDCDFRKKDHEECECRRKERFECECRKISSCRRGLKLGKATIKCGCPSSTTLGIVTVGETPITVSSLTINFDELCSPCVKLEFASNIITPVVFTGTLNFQVFKLCRGQFTPVPVGPVWTFSRLVGVAEANTFSFFVCDCDSCFDDCCTYTVVVTAGLTTTGTISINNATLGAIITESECNC
jgi:hypothetical protein